MDLTYMGADTPDFVIKSMFSKFDADGSGSISRDELESLFSELGLGTDEAEVAKFMLDKDGDNCITFEEFLAWVKGAYTTQEISSSSERFQLMKQALDMFKQYDTDGNGTIEGEEFSTLMKASGCTTQAEIDSAMKALDKDGSGEISFREFLAWLQWVPLEESG